MACPLVVLGRASRLYKRIVRACGVKDQPLRGPAGATGCRGSRPTTARDGWVARRQRVVECSATRLHAGRGRRRLWAVFDPERRGEISWLAYRRLEAAGNANCLMMTAQSHGSGADGRWRVCHPCRFWKFWHFCRRQTPYSSVFGVSGTYSRQHRRLLNHTTRLVLLTGESVVAQSFPTTERRLVDVFFVGRFTLVYSRIVRRS